MAEGIVVGAITEAVLALVSHLGDVRNTLKHNRTAADDILNLEHALYENLTRLRKLLPVNVNGAAIDALLAKLKAASEFVETHQRKGSFKRVWSARQTKERLDQLRKDLDDAFQMALLLTTLDVTLDAGEKNKNFQAEMLCIYEHHAANELQSKEELKSALGVLAEKIDPIGSKLHSLVGMVKKMSEDIHQTTEMEKFVADIIANLSLEGRGDEAESAPGQEIPEEFLDPIMLDLMCDPVKATDGFTYNRWSIIDVTQSPLNPGMKKPFGIAFDDFSLRRRLFERFPTALAEFRWRRQSYREEALRFAAEGLDAEALVRLNNVLLWDENDVECQRAKDNLEHPESHRPAPSSPVSSSSSRRSGGGAAEVTRLENQVSQELTVEEFLDAFGAIEVWADRRAPIANSTLQQAVRNLAKKYQDKRIIGATSGVFERILNLLTSSRRVLSEHNIEEVLLISLAELLEATDNLVTFSSLPGSSKVIISSLARKDPPWLQWRALKILVSVTGAQEIPLWKDIKRGSYDLYKSLGDLLAAAEHRVDVLWVLANISRKKAAVDLKLYKAIPHGLVKWLTELTVEELQERLLTAIFMLCNHEKENHLAVATAPGAFEVFLHLFATTSSGYIHRHSLFMITTSLTYNLANYSSETLTGDIHRHPLFMITTSETDNLANNSSEGVDIDTLKGYIERIRRFACTDTMALKFMGSPRVLVTLVDCLQENMPADDDFQIVEVSLIALILVTASPDASARRSPEASANVAASFRRLEEFLAAFLTREKADDVVGLGILLELILTNRGQINDVGQLAQLRNRLLFSNIRSLGSGFRFLKAFANRTD